MNTYLFTYASALVCTYVSRQVEFLSELDMFWKDNVYESVYFSKQKFYINVKWLGSGVGKKKAFFSTM
jgi:hypothetical protein